MALLAAVSQLALFLFLRRRHDLKQQQQALKNMAHAERDRLKTEVAQRAALLTDLNLDLQTAREDERHRLAHKLYGELGSQMAGAAAEALGHLDHLVHTLNLSIALGRSIIKDLRPSTLANLGLEATLEILARGFGGQSNVCVECALSPVRLGASAELMVYRLVQQAIANISKFAAATHVWVSLGAPNALVEVSVRDDGIGVDVAAPAKSAFGLPGMRLRVEAEGGRLTVISAAGQGMRVMVSLPESGPPVAA